YFNRPDQRGIFSHFQKISESTDLPIVIYNIPYRTGRNIENETIYKLAELKNITGIKDSCGDIKQTMELLLNPPENFSILTGEDLLYFTTLTLGAHGGVLASAHLYTAAFIDIYNYTVNNNHTAALEIWKKIHPVIQLLFAEPNPSPIKYCLYKLGLIQSSETRLPLVEITPELERKLDTYLL
ncbi:MAG TPA: dihydrodipicolinate synthase family protein, partial [Chitinispirillaceae bacterium]|nr:dihydrodipicolinate synthase family protein [Chitinispirillaceae bacterium]